jgi:VWFA-related protein
LRAVPVLFFLLPNFCRAESAAANAPPSVPQAAGQNGTANVPVLKVRSDLVLVDVVVTKNGVPVKGLSKDQFRVLENGKEQQLKVFEVHEQSTAPSNAPAAKAPELAPNNYSDFTPYPPSSAVNVLLLDSLNTPSADQAYVRKQMLLYLKKIPPGTRMAVFTLSSQLRLIQGFTADASLLAKAINDKGDIKRSTPEGTKSSDEELLAIQHLEEAVALQPGGQAAAANAAQMGEVRADLKSHSTDDQEQMTLAALRQIGRYLSAIPGRKNLVWFSGSFPLFIDRGPNTANRDYAKDVRETDRLLAAARIAVYPVDARGLLWREGAVADASVDPKAVFGFTPPAPGRASIMMMGAQKQAVHEADLPDLTIQQIAADTGGKAFVNTNGFQEAIQQALADGANYYTIGYMPQLKEDGSFRRIKVNVNGGYQLAYRDGYYADNAQSAANSSASTMKEAIEFGAPPLSDILFKVRVIPAGDPVAKGFTPAPGPAGADAKDLKPPLTRYLIDYMVDAHHFTFQRTPDGVAHMRLEFAVLAYDADGKVINLTEHAFGLDLRPALYAQIMSGGFPEHQEIDLPTGQVVLRIVVRDLDSPKAGATEVPLMVAKK